MSANYLSKTLALLATHEISSELKAFTNVKIIEAFDNSWVKAYLQLWNWIYFTIWLFAFCDFENELIFDGVGISKGWNHLTLDFAEC